MSVRQKGRGCRGRGYAHTYRVLAVQLLQQRVVRGFGEVRFLVQQSQEAQFLWKQQMHGPQVQVQVQDPDRIRT